MHAVKRFLFRLMLLFAALVLCLDVCAQNADALDVQFNKKYYQPGDSIFMDASLKYRERSDAACTLNLCIESLQTGKKWRYRYPLINGYLGSMLFVDSSMPEGNYAFNFQLQPLFFQLNGTVQNPGRNEKSIRYMLCTKNMQMSTDTILLDDGFHFRTGRMLFQDSGIIIFSRLSKRKNDLKISLESELDSSYRPILSLTRFISISKNELSKNNLKMSDTVGYVFQPEKSFVNYKMLEVVKMETKAKKLVDKFAKENVSPLFSSDDALVLDGLESDDISKSSDIMNFIRGRVAGFEVEMNEFGSKKIKRRKQHTDIYINEIKVTEDELDLINPSDVAMIKVFRPGTLVAFSSGEGGAIVVYTKIGSYAKVQGNSYTFPLVGYSGLEIRWMP